jgi:NTE family protein
MNRIVSKRPLGFLLGLALTLLPVFAVAAERPACIGLVLGGGGARGAAHIGVLKVLERERIPVCRIAGTSMGSIVGGLYAAGYTAEEIESILRAIDWRDVLADDPPRIDFPMRRKNDTLRYLLDFKLGVRDGTIQLPRGVIQGQKLLTLLRRLTIHTWRTENFDALPIPFRAIGTDIGAGEAVVFDRGDLALAIRASMSVPGAFAPIRVDGRLMVDGGIVNNVPVDVVREMGADRLIVVDVGAPLLSESELNSPFAITMQMLDVLMKQRTAQVMAALDPADITIVPALGDIGSASFDRAVETIPLGEAAAEAALPRLRELALDEAGYAAWRAGQARVEFDAPTIAFLDVVKRRSATAGYVQRELESVEGERLDALAMERQINSVYGQGNYERISWRLVERDGSTGVEVTPVDKGWGPNFLTFGLQVSDDFAGRATYQLGAEYTMTGLNRWGGEWRTRAEFGRVGALRTEFFQPGGDRGQYFAMPYAEYRALDQDLRVAGSVVSTFRLRRRALGFDVGWEPTTTWRLYGGLFRARGNASQLVGPANLAGGLTEDAGGARIGFIRDTLDDADFPSRGGRTELLVTANREVLGSEGNGEIADWVWDHAFSHGAHRLLLGARLHTTWGEAGLFEAVAPLGGFTNLSGYNERELLDDHLGLFRAVYYRRLGDAGKLFSVPVYIGASAETGNVFPTRERLLDLDGLVLAGSLFVGVDSPFGPVFLGYGANDDGESSFYLNFGTLLRPRQ